MKNFVISFFWKTNTVIDISPSIPYLAKFWFLIYGSKCRQPIKLQDSLKCNISRKKWMMKFIFGMRVNIEKIVNIVKIVFCKLILSIWVCVTRYAQSTQNERFEYLCNISRKVWNMKLTFCLQINTKVFYKFMLSIRGGVSRMPNVPKTTSLQYLCNISRKTWSMKLIFCLQINIQGFLKLIL